MVKHFIGEQYFTNSFGMKFRLIPAGTFIMGSPKTEEDLDHDEHQHEVTITKSFWMGVNPVTQMQYEKIMGTNPSYFLGSQVQGDGSNYPVKIKSFSPCLHPNVQGDSSNHPVEMVSWDNSVEFCELLSQLPEEKKAGRVYRLPTEAEWEYACRAGTTTTYSFGESSDLLGDYAWIGGNSGEQTHPVCEKKPNAWGLYDMHGNVWEWCSDWYGEYPKGAVSDPSGPNKGWDRVFRGGCWGNVAADCRSAYRNGDVLPNCHGFRVALSSSGIPQSPEADK